MSTKDTASTVKPSKTGPRATPPPAQTGNSASGGSGFGHKTTKYLGEVKTELRKTTWPTREELISQTKVVLGLLVVVGVFISTWDYVLGKIFSGVLALLGVRVEN